MTKYLLLSAVLSWAACIWANRSVGTGDNYAAAFLALVAGIVGAILTVAYFGAAFWNHRFW